ncbi:MAG: VCBS repeat-containing protein [Ignavibacteria bacterium]|nr:VCBS repeat-containing protein [Ignavibacteria bacterium]
MRLKFLQFFFFVFIFLFSNVYSQTYQNIAQQIGINSTYFDDYYIPGGGAGFADFDNDGDIDLLVASRTHFIMYRNDNGIFTDITSQSGINFTGDCLKSVVWGDFNNDGWRDVYLTSWYSGSRLYKNNGNGTFSDITASSGVSINFNYQTTTAAWGDINRDGLLDLYVGNYGNIENAGEQPNYFFKNNGNETFTDITESSGAKDSLYKKPLAIVIFDFNMDGWQDIYIAMDKHQRSTLFKNLGNSTFQDVTYSSNTMCYFDAMGIAVGDYNHDGLLDMHVSNGPPGNATFKNNGNGTFTDVAVQTNTTINKECWGNSFIDYDNDGWCDLYATASAGIDMCDVLYKNNQNGTFSNIGFSIGIGDSTFSYGVAKGDYNNDGYPDIMTTMSRDSVAHFYKNSGGTNNWIKLKCIGVQSNKDAIGSIVTTYAGGVINRQVILGGSSYLSSDDVELIFGIGSNQQADSIVILWPSGIIDRSINIQKNNRYTALEGSGVIGITPISSEVPSSFSLSQNYPNPFNPGTKIKFSIKFTTKVNLSVFDMTGKLVETLIDQNLIPGTYESDFNSRNLSSGVYFYRLNAGGFTETKKMSFIK